MVVAWDLSCATYLCSVLSTSETSPKFTAPNFSPTPSGCRSFRLCGLCGQSRGCTLEMSSDTFPVREMLSCVYAGETTMSHKMSETESCTYFITGHQERIVDSIFWRAGVPFSLWGYVGSNGSPYSCPWQSQAALGEPVALWTGKRRRSALESGHIREMTGSG